ncbi:MAG TPA: hypothetical protein VMM76_06335 [Pirellulaceae bacterium]|nr:hypothetical protein [Pirellulaceae bacterium]
MTSRHLYELIDACRPSQEDIDRPEFSELAKELSQDSDLRRVFARSQEVDLAIQKVFQDVTPPPGFAERLLESIDKLETSPAVAEAEPRVETAQRTTPEARLFEKAELPVEPCVEPARRSSRRSLAIMAGIASLSAIAATIAIWLAMPQPITTPTDHAIAEIVDQWNTDLNEANWQTAVNIPSEEFPTGQYLKLSREDRWQWVSKRRTVCYDLVITPRKNGEIVRLFVNKPTSPVSLPATPPDGYPSPLGWHVGAWQANGRVYYLAVYAERDIKAVYSSVVGPRIAPA